MIDYKFIQQLEGYELEGYVPKPDGGVVESGVTIASGFDIGQRGHTDLVGLSDSLVNKLTQYLGVTGECAVKYIKIHPLNITEKEARELNLFAHQDAEIKLIADWEEWSMRPWGELTDRQQTVIASVAFQYGDLPTRTPNFWRQAINADWGALICNLRKFGDSYNTRRNKEADYFVGII